MRALYILFLVVSFCTNAAIAANDRWRYSNIVVEEQDLLIIKNLPFKSMYSNPETEVSAIFNSFTIIEREVNLVNLAGIKLSSMNIYPTMNAACI